MKIEVGVRVENVFLHRRGTVTEIIPKKWDNGDNFARMVIRFDDGATGVWALREVNRWFKPVKRRRQMPCFINGPETPEERARIVEHRRQQGMDDGVVVAILCAMVRKYGIEQVLALDLDWNEAGVSKEELKNWWLHHQLEDDARWAEANEGL
jgi:hypothetical protein